MSIYSPLRLEPSLHSRVWGGRTLEVRLGKTLPTAEPYGESWEIFWKNTLKTGGWAGKTLGEAIAADPLGMVGRADAGPEYPLLVKFLDSHDWLSVQVHPDDNWAQKLEGEPRGKTECWYVIAAEPGAQIAYGISEPLDAEGFRLAVQQGRAKSVMQYVNVAPGDFIFVPAGTMHALGTGLLIYELQQTSDTTYRVYDWDRMGLDGSPRPLHLEKALAVTQYRVNPQAKVPYEVIPGQVRTRLIEGQYFGLEKITLEGDSVTLDTETRRAHLLSCIQGEMRIEGAAFTPESLRLGDSIFIPAGVGQYSLHGSGETLLAWAR